MKARLTKLIDVKTIVTFTFTATFTYLSVRDKIEPQVFMTIYTTIIGFYFGIQHEKHKGGDNNAN
jgi:hypothetical protein